MDFKKSNKTFKDYNWKFIFFCAVFLFFSGIDSAIGEGKIVAITHGDNSISSLKSFKVKSPPLMSSSS